MHPFEAQIAHFIARERLPEGGPVIVGLSGGADSVALLTVLRALGRECVAVHCHFGLRGEEADRDMRHAEAVAARLGAEFIAERFDTHAYMREHRVSAEMACRELRYALFRRLMVESGAVAIAVAHHREDNIETMLLNLLRGCGLHGVKAMQPWRNNVMRPLLEASRADIEAYLADRGLEFVVDSTNLENNYRRNLLRNSVLPALYEAFPGAAERLTDSLRHLRGCDALYTSLIPNEFPPLSEIRASAAPLTLLHELLAPYGFNAEQLTDILTAGSGAEFRSATHRLCVSRDRLEIMGESAKPQLVWSEITPEEFHPQEGELYLDSSALDGDPEWELRPWRQGDRMRPYGMKGTRLLSDIFASAKLTAAQKEAQWVLTRNGVILWAVGLRASAHFPVTSTSSLIIKATASGGERKGSHHSTI